MKKVLLFVVMVLLAFMFLSADIYTKSMERTLAFEIMGKKQPESVEIKETWFSQNKFAQHGKIMSIIVDNEKKKVNFVIHPEKIYIEFSTDLTREKLMAMLPPKVKEMVSSVAISGVKVKRNGLKKQVANWSCEGTDMEMTFMIPALSLMPKFKMTMWTTKDVGFDYKTFANPGADFFARYIIGLMNIDQASMKELEKMNSIEGFQVAADVTVSVFGSEINVEGQTLEISEKPAPAGTYSAPAGYKKMTLSDVLGGVPKKLM